MPLPTAPGWQPIFNTTTQPIPAFGVAVFSPERSDYLNGPAGANDYYSEQFAGQVVVRVKQADEDFLALSPTVQAARIWINGPTPILPKRIGMGTRQWPAQALTFSTSQVLPIPGDQLGLVQDQWYLTVAGSTTYLPTSSYPVGGSIARFLAWDGRQAKSTYASKPRIALIDGLPAKNPQLARTVVDPDATPTYPTHGVSCAKAFPIVFLSGGFLEQAINQSAQYTLHASTPQAHVFSVTHNYIPVSTELEVWHDQGNDPNYPGRWWTVFRDPVRIGITTEAIAKNANGRVNEINTNNYSAETEVLQSWLCRNWCGYDLATNTRVFFSQRRGVAYINNADCEPE